MYIRLGTIKTTLVGEKNRDFTIISEIVPNCSMSYEVPKFVRTKTELDIWFGDFSSKSYLLDLLNSGVSLFLYRPVMRYEDVVLVTTNDINPSTGENYTEKEADDHNSYLEEKKSSVSFYNRDTLDLYEDAYCHPEYNKSDQAYSTLPNPSVEDIKENIDNVEKNLGSYVYTLTEDEELEEGSYVVIPVNSGKLLFYTGNTAPIDGTLQGQLGITDAISYTKNNVKENLLAGGWTFCNTGDENVMTFGSTVYRENLEFYNGGLSFEPNQKLCQNKISDALNDSLKVIVSPTETIPGTPIIKFWSRTIGQGTTPIKIKNEKTDEGYLISITRGGYSEYFEGTLSNIEGSIMKDSNLVYCDLLNSSPELPEGEWTLSGAEKERFNPSSYRSALEVLNKNMDYDTYPDFHLVPNPSDYVEEEIYTYDDLYKNFLGISNQCGCQFLIQNDASNYASNYTKDVDSRLIWFFGNIFVGNARLPGYYTFLKGLLQNNYSLESTDIYYSSPATAPYDSGDVEELDKYRSNYLVYNNHKYYFKKYLSGSNTSIWTRFVFGKVERELQKQKWDYLGSKQGTYKKINLILEEIAKVYSGLIRSIEISLYYEDPTEETLYLQIDTVFSDIPDKDMTLDIVINYSKN